MIAPLLRPKRPLSLTEAVNIILKDKTCDKKNELQSLIHPDVNFRRNSVNLLIGRRGSGKTYNIFRELTKLAMLGNDSFTLLLYVTDKQREEDTVARFADDVTIPIRKVTYANAEAELKNIIEAKVAYDQVYEYGIDDLTEESYTDITSTVGTTDFSIEKPHTIVLYDDAMCIFSKPKSYLNAALHQNRQPRITYFLCIQDPKGIDASVKSDLDTFWLFGGFNRMRFNQMMYQTSVPMETKDLWEKYASLSMNQALIIDNKPSGTELRIIRQ